MQSARSTTHIDVLSDRLNFFMLAVAIIIAIMPRQSNADPFLQPPDMRWQDIPLQGQTVKQPDPAPTPPPAIYDVPGGNFSSSTNVPPPLTPQQLQYLKDNAVTLEAPSKSAATSTPVLAPKSEPAPFFTTPNNQTFNNDGNTATAKPTASPPASPTTAATPSIKSTAAPTTSNLASFGVTKQDVVTIRTASATPISTPTMTDVWNAPGKPIKFVAVPDFKLTGTTYLPRRTTQTYVSQSDGSAEFANILGSFLLGFAQGYASSGGGFHSGGGSVGRGRIGGPCDYWTSHVNVCRSVR